MRKLALLLTVLLLALPVYGQDSVNTEQQYIRQLWAAYTPSGSDKEAEVEVPSWARGFIVMVNTDSCSSCAADYHIRSYYPGTSTAYDFVASAGGISATGWDCVVFHPDSIDSSTCDKIRVPALTGTAIIQINVTSGTMSSSAWIRWVKEKQ